MSDSARICDTMVLAIPKEVALGQRIEPVEGVPAIAATKVARIGVKTADAMTIPMPASLEDVVGAIGMAAALKMVEAYGGTSPRLPAKRNVVESHPMAQVIGLDNLRTLINKIGGGRYVYVPRCTDGLRLQRDRQIVELSRTVSVDELARRFKISDRQVWSILKKTPMDDGQESLFKEKA